MASLRGLSRHCRSGVEAVTDTVSDVFQNSGGARFGAIFHNLGPSTVYLGDDEVTSANGFPLAANATVPFDSHSGRVYAVCASGQTADLRYVEFLERL